MHVNGSAAAAGAGSVASMRLNRVTKWSVYALMMFPIIDFGLRYTVHAIHPLGMIWDKVIFLILLVAMVVRYATGFRPPRYRWHVYAAWFILFGLGLTIAGLANPLIAVQGYRDDVYYLLFAFLLPFVIGPEDVMPLFHVGATVAILIAMHAIYQYITKAPYPASWNDISTDTVRTRAYSVFTSSNELGSYMALMTPMMTGLAIHERDKIRKWTYGVGAFMCLLALLFTYTRGAWLALALSLFIVSVLFERRLLIVIVLFGIVGFFLPPIHHRMAEFLSPVYWLKSAQSGRIDRWMQAFQTMSNNPLLGAGVGQYGGAVASIYSNGIYSDNFYAKIMGETGLIGLTLFLTTHLGLLRDLVRHALSPLKRSSKGRGYYLVLGGLTGLLAMLIHNGTENVFEFPANVLTYFLYATLLLAYGRAHAKEADHASNEPIQD